MTDTAALRALLAAATPGPWSKPFPDGALTSNGIDSLLGLDADGMAVVHRPEDAALIAAAVNALPGLLDEAEKAERERDDAVRAAADQDEASAQRAALVEERDALRAWVREALPWLRAAVALDARLGMDTDGIRLHADGRALLGEEK